MAAEMELLVVIPQRMVLETKPTKATCKAGMILTMEAPILFSSHQLVYHLCKTLIRQKKLIFFCFFLQCLLRPLQHSPTRMNGCTSLIIQNTVTNLELDRKPLGN